MTKSVCVIGAGGATGHEIVSELRKKGDHVKAIVRDPQKYEFASDVDVLKGDVADSSSMEECLK